jgi:hypothetical protein
MTRFFCVIFLLLCSLWLCAQPARGRVVDHVTGESLPFAIIVATNGKFEKYSDENGYFVLPGTDQPLDTLLVSYVGYQTRSVYVPAYSDENLVLVRLKASAVLPTVQVTGQDKYSLREGGVMKPPVDELVSTPALLGEADPMKALAALPGISNGFEGSASLLVRGGNANQTDLVLDGVRLLNVDHAGGLLSAVPSFGLKSVTVYKGGVPGRYGGRLSGVVDFRYRDGREDGIYREHSVGTALLRTGVEGSIGKRGVKFLTVGRLSYPTLIQAAVISGQVEEGVRGSGQTLVLGDGLARLSFPLLGWRVTTSYFVSGDVGFEQFDGSSILDRFSFRWSNNAYSIRARKILSPRLELSHQLSYLKYKQEFQARIWEKLPEISLQRNSLDEANYGRLTFRSQADYQLTAKSKVIAGLEVANVSNTGMRNELLQATQFSALEQDILSVSPYVQLDYVSADDRLRAMLAVRGDFSPTVSLRLPVQPRLRLSYQLNQRLNINAGYDRSIQFEHQLQTTATLVPTNILLLANEQSGTSASEQFSLGLSGELGAVRWTVEGFHKSMDGLLRVKPGFEGSSSLYEQFDETNYAFNGTGESLGLEFYLKKRKGAVRYTLAYTLGRSTRRYETLNQGRRYPFQFDRRHDLNFQLSYHPSKKTSLHADFVYQTGISLTAPILVSGFFYVYDGINNARYPPFHRLNVSLQRNWPSKKRADKTHTLVFSIYNAYARKNAYFLDARFNRTTRVDPATGATRPVIEQQLIARSAFGLIPGISYRVSIVSKR